MRTLLFALAGCLACAHAPARVAQFAPACPSPDSLRTAQSSAPPRQVRPPAPPPANAQGHIFIDGGRPRERYATFVIDSQYVGLVDQWATDSATYPLRGLPTTDIASIEVFKDKYAIDRWRGCPDVPVVLITTTSKSWRPRSPAVSKPCE